MEAYPPIENHGIIGDLHTVALVSTDATIDFLCFPDFDSPSIFASLLDAQRGGSFELAPSREEATRKQIYLPDSNILLTRFLSAEGVAEISDFMPVEEDGVAHNLVRRVKAVRGESHIRMRLAPRFDYGRARHHIERNADGAVVFIPEGGPNPALRLRTEVPVEIRNGDACAEFTLRSGESAAFVLEQATAGEESPCSAAHYVADSFKQTLNFWRSWIGRSTYNGRWREMVNRSALTLKLLFSQKHGSMVAAATYGLPEEIGGERNWDYRYTWIRDTSFAAYALFRLGYTDEAARFMDWIGARCAEIETGDALGIMYAADGHMELKEEELRHFAGYRGSVPVRIGNAAYNQLQLDIYGELMDAVYLHDKYGSQISYDLWCHLVPLVDWVCDNWQLPDEGIWETRGPRQEFLFSRLMCWVALDRAIRLARKRSLPGPLPRWFETRDEIYRDIFTNFWNARLGAFVQYKGATVLDAGALIMPLVRFISAKDPRFLSTLRAIEADLVSDSLVYRYHTGDHFSDGLEGREGTFSLCSFWYVECLSRSGDLEKARFYFEKMLGYANHLGLFAEQLGPRGEHLGNFPQAFTHLALISAAYDLDRRLSVAGRPE